MTTKEIDALVEACECAFYSTLADKVPADSGDLDPAIAAHFSAIARATIIAWLAANVGRS